MRTPGPWRIERHGYESSYMAHAFIEPGVGAVWWPDGNEEQQANAEHIVRACNSHDALVEALREIAKGEGRFSRDPLEHASNTVEDMQALAVKAIAKAEGR